MAVFQIARCPGEALLQMFKIVEMYKISSADSAFIEKLVAACKKETPWDDEVITVMIHRYGMCEEFLSHPDHKLRLTAEKIVTAEGAGQVFDPLFFAAMGTITVSFQDKPPAYLYDRDAVFQMIVAARKQLAGRTIIPG